MSASVACGGEDASAAGAPYRAACRCRYIVISDGGCDSAYSFGDLSNAVRRIRLDLGIPILFDPLTQTREGQGKTNQLAGRAAFVL